MICFTIMAVVIKGLAGHASLDFHAGIENHINISHVWHKSCPAC